MAKKKVEKVVVDGHEADVVLYISANRDKNGKLEQARGALTGSGVDDRELTILTLLLLKVVRKCFDNWSAAYGKMTLIDVLTMLANLRIKGDLGPEFNEKADKALRKFKPKGKGN